MTYTPRKKRRRRLDPEKETPEYRQMWRVVDGALADAFRCHPDYLAKSEVIVRRSVVKRVVGAVLGYARQKASPGGIPDEGPVRVQPGGS